MPAILIIRHGQGWFGACFADWLRLRLFGWHASAIFMPLCQLGGMLSGEFALKTPNLPSERTYFGLLALAKNYPIRGGNYRD